MITCFKKTTILYFVCAPLSALLISLFTFPTTVVYWGAYPVTYRGLPVFSQVIRGGFGDYVLWFVSVVVAVLCVAAACLILAGKLHKALLNLLFENCDPQAFLTQYTPLLTKGKTKYLKKIFMANYATGLLAAGDSLSATGVLSKAIAMPYKPKHALSQAALYLNLSSCCLRQEPTNISQAQFALDKASQLLMENTSKPTYPLYQKQLLDTQMNLLIAQGETSAPIVYFQSCLASAPHNYARVNAHYSLFLAYCQTQELAMQHTHLSAIANLGGTMGIARLAKSLLTQRDL